MINAGIIQELDFMSEYYESEVTASISCKGKETKLDFKDGRVTVTYQGTEIWKETVHGEATWFGIESCDRIHKIVKCIDNNDDSWKQKYAWGQPTPTAYTPSLEEAKKNTEL